MIRLERLQRLPVSILPTFVGVSTLGNIYLILGFSWIRHFSMFFVAVSFFLYIIKILLYPKTILCEYSNAIPASLYSGFSMIMMSLGGYTAEFAFSIGKAIWMMGIFIHIVHIIVFTYNNVLKVRDIHSFLPSWFVTYTGILVGAVVGKNLGELWLIIPIIYFGIAIYFIMLPIMIVRLIKVEVKLPVYHTTAVLLSPCSLCLAAYINIVDRPSPVLVCILYTCILLSLLFIVFMLPRFFAIAFNPGFAGMTFPMAIGALASMRMKDYVMRLNMDAFADIINQIAGFQIYLTTMIVSYVVLNFIIMALRLERIESRD